MGAKACWAHLNGSVRALGAALVAGQTRLSNRRRRQEWFQGKRGNAAGGEGGVRFNNGRSRFNLVDASDESDDGHIGVALMVDFEP